MRPWTHSEEEDLRILGPVIGGRACADAFGRTYDSIKCRASALGIRLHRSKTFDTLPTPLPEREARWLRQLATAPLCPACGRRPVTVLRTGLCGRCHLEALAAAHEEKIARAEAQRVLWAARSKLQRRRRALSEAV